MTTLDGWRRCTPVLFLALALHGSPVLAQPANALPSLEVLCLTSRPTIEQGTNTSLHAWAVISDGTPVAHPVSLTWVVSAGAVHGTGTEVAWDLSEVRLDTGELHRKVTATVTGAIPGAEPSTCTIDVFIGRPMEVSQGSPDDPEPNTSDTRSGLRSARHFLLPNESEKPGYGLYSYLLFPVRPRTNEEKARYLKTLEACKQAMEDVEDHLAHHRPPSHLNVTHIPVTKIPQHSQAAGEWAANVLAVYDYTMAQKLLDRLNPTYQQGPYLISVQNHPLSDATTSVQEILLQDFTGKVPELAAQVLALFTYRAAQQRHWRDIALREFALSFRNLIAVAGKVTPAVADTLFKLVSLSEVR